MTLNLIGLIIGFLILMKSADWFTSAAIEMAKKLRVPQIIIGATIVSLATTLPEFAVSFLAACQGKVDMSVGNAVGSVICNVGLILGSCAILSPMLVDQSGFIKSGIKLIFVAFLFGILSYIKPEGSRLIGLAMVACLILYLVAQFKTAKDNRAPIEENPNYKNWGWIIALFTIGALGVTGGSRIVVFTAEQLARILGISELVISLTILAVGTSLPEYVVSVMSIIKKTRSLSLGNIIGANILNLVWVIGISSLVRPLPLKWQTLIIDIPMMWTFSVLLVIFGKTNAQLARWEGIVLFSLYVAYVLVTVLCFRNG